MRHASLLLVCLLGVAPLHAEPLPTGFGGINVGMPWREVEVAYSFQSRDEPATAWDALVRGCGYRSVAIAADSGQLLVDVADDVVTSVSFVSSLQPGSDLLSVADLVLSTYGEPERATQRDGVGQVTLDRAAVASVTLEYVDPHPVLFSISGDPLWQYQVKVDYAHERWHMNRMLRCARDREKSATAPVSQ